MTNNLQRLIDTCCQMGAARTLELLGLTSGEISQRKARDTYGKWFQDAVAAGRLRPVRIEEGRGGAKKYRVVDILELKAADSVAAELTKTI